MNSITLLGNLTKSPQYYKSAKGMSIINTSIAVNDRRNPEKTMFIDIVAFAGLADIFNKYTNKGTKVLIQGRIEYDTFTDKNGNNRSKHKVIVDELEMLDSKRNGYSTPEPQPDQSVNDFFEEFPKSYVGIEEDEIPF